MIAAALLSLGAIAAPLPVQAIARDTAQPVIVELAIGRLARATVAAYRLGDEALLPLGRFFDLSEIEVERLGPDRVEAILHPGERRFVVDPTSGSVSFDQRERTVSPESMVVEPSEVYLPATVIGALLDLEWSVSWADLVATVVDPSRLPIAVRLTRDWQRRTRELVGEGLVAERTLESDVRTVDGLVVDYSVLAPSGRPLDQAAYSTALGLELLGGSLTAAAQSQDQPGRARIRSDFAWSGVFHDRPWITQLRLGDGFATGPRPRTLRGLSFGNAPFVRPNYFGTTAFSGNLDPGWTLEAYRGGRMIAFDSVNALGEFAIDAPIQYGENPVDFVAYGPFGEIRRFNRTLRVDADRIPAGSFEYGVAAGACRAQLCQATMNLDARYGVSPRWTVRGGLDQFWRGGMPDLFHPYVGVAGHLTSVVSVDAELVANAVARATVRYDPSIDLALTGEVLRFARGVTDPILTPDGRRGQATLTAFYRPNRDWGATYLEASVDRISTDAGSFLSGRVGGSWQRGELQLLPSVRWQHDRAGGRSADRISYGTGMFLLASPRFGALLSGITSRATLEFEGALAPKTLTAFASRNLGRHLRLELGGGWLRGQGGLFSLTLAANLPTLRSYTTASHSAGRTSASQLFQGSVLYDPSRSRVSLGAGPSIDRSGVTGRVFLDANGNERFDPGEQPLSAVRVSVGMQTRVSGADGSYRLWNVTPHEPALVAIDSTTLASPLWVPTYRAIQIRPAPNRYEVVDIPVAPGGVIEGRAVFAADSAPVGGLALELLHVASGASRTLVTFRDGAFYSIGIKPGEYLLRVEERVARRLQLGAEPIRITMPASPEGATIADLLLLLRQADDQSR
ncbi:MAG: carboxypeptidase-like regulatory domain-containing protein [Gemmatimonadales bacterium]